LRDSYSDQIILNWCGTLKILAYTYTELEVRLGNLYMKEETIPKVTLNQMEDALEERQKPDRRADNAGHNPESKTDRRQGSRRDKAKALVH
jgi:hypothetical protein